MAGDTRGSDTLHTRYARKGTPTAMLRGSMHVGQCMPSLELSHQGRRTVPSMLPMAQGTTQAMATTDGESLRVSRGSSQGDGDDSREHACGSRVDRRNRPTAGRVALVCGECVLRRL